MQTAIPQDQHLSGDGAQQHLRTDPFTGAVRPGGAEGGERTQSDPIKPGGLAWLSGGAGPWPDIVSPYLLAPVVPRV
jgi:hypothetical protein